MREYRSFCICRAVAAVSTGSPGWRMGWVGWPAGTAKPPCWAGCSGARGAVFCGVTLGAVPRSLAACAPRRSDTLGADAALGSGAEPADAPLPELPEPGVLSQSKALSPPSEASASSCGLGAGMGLGKARVASPSVVRDSARREAACCRSSAVSTTVGSSEEKAASHRSCSLGAELSLPFACWLAAGRDSGCWLCCVFMASDIRGSGIVWRPGVCGGSRIERVLTYSLCSDWKVRASSRDSAE